MYDTLKGKKHKSKKDVRKTLTQNKLWNIFE
jgi:hypothetical protein